MAKSTNHTDHSRPASGKAKKPAKKRSWWKSWRGVLAVFLALFALGLGVLGGLYVAIDVPEPDDFALAQTTTVTYDNGEKELGQFSELNRSSVPLDKISETLQHAVVASEDRRFYENSGIDLKGISRALWNNLRGKPTQGGSTLTQQYAERYYMGTTTSIPGKIREAILAIKIDGSQSKEEILEKYLNTIYFGRGAYGIEAAAHAYFGVSAAELDLSQSALLAGVIPAPSAWDPAVDPEKAKERYDRVLNLMQKDRWITSAEKEKASFPETKTLSSNNSLEGPNGHLLMAVRQELIDLGGFSEEEINTSGFRVVTTINEEKQQDAVNAVANLPKDRPKNNHVGLVSVNPTNGEIVAMYGGEDYLKRQRNSATQDRAQGGSTFKLFGLTAALDDGVSLYKTYNAPGVYEIPGSGGLRFRNVDGRSYGHVNLIQMTGLSLNTAYIQLNQDIGPEKTQKMAVRLGLPADTPGLDDGVGNVLGSASVTPAEMARVVSTIANEGKRTTPHIIREVYRGDSLVYQGPTEEEQVIDKEVAQKAITAMQAVFNRGGSAATANIGRPAAGKTGTSSGPVSAWFVGFVPNMVTVVDMYQVGDDGSEQVMTSFGGLRTIYGGSYPARIWRDYMRAALRGTPIENFAGSNYYPQRTERREEKEPEENPAIVPPPERPQAPEPAPEPEQPKPEDPAENPESPGA